MKKSLVFLFFLVLSVVAFATNAPPDNPDMNRNHVYIPAVDNFTIVTPVAYVQPEQVSVAYQMVTVYAASEYEYTVLMVPEVAAVRKISVNTTASGYATENYAENAVLCSTDPLNEYFRSASRYSTKWQTTNEFQQNCQHSNYGYPFTAN